jgi:transposase-like protein
VATTNVIESPNSVVRRVTRRVTNYRDADMVVRWVAAGFLEAERAFKRLRGKKNIADIIHVLRPAPVQLKKVT